MPHPSAPDVTLTPKERYAAFLTASLRLIGDVHRSAVHIGLDREEVAELEMAINGVRRVRNALIRRGR